MLSMCKKSVTMREDKDSEKEVVMSSPVNTATPDAMLESLGTSFQKIASYIEKNYSESVFILPLVQLQSNDETDIRKFFQISGDIKDRLRSLAQAITDEFHSRYDMPDVDIRFGLSSNQYTLFAVKR